MTKLTKIEIIEMAARDKSCDDLFGDDNTVLTAEAKILEEKHFCAFLVEIESGKVLNNAVGATEYEALTNLKEA